MADSNVSSLAVFGNGSELDYIEKDGVILFTAEDIGRCLGYQNPAHAIHKIYRGNESELKHYSTETKTVSVDGKMRETRAFTEEGVYIISMLARTNQAKKFRAQVALLLRRIRKEQTDRLVSLAHEAGFTQALEKARSLPAIEADRKAAYLDGMKEGARIQKRQDPLLSVVKASEYLRKGLTISEASILTGCPKTTLRDRMKKVCNLAEVLRSPKTMEQGSLL